MGWFTKKSDQWERRPGEVAVRIGAEDVKRDFLNKPFVVWDGTAALVFTDGVMVGRLAAGKHDIDGTLRSWLTGGQQTTLIIADDGDIAAEFEITGLSSREHHAVQAKVRVIVRVEDPASLYRNLMKDRRSYLLEDLRAYLQPEIREALMAFTSTNSVEELYSNPSLRVQCEDRLRERTVPSLGRIGFALVAVTVADLISPAYDGHRAKRADADLESRRVDLTEERAAVIRRYREILAGDATSKAATESERDNAIRQAMHDVGLKDRVRGEELAQLEARIREDAADYDQRRSQSRAAESQTHELGQDAQRRGHERDQSRHDGDARRGETVADGATRETLRDQERGGDEKDFDLARKMRDDALAAKKRKELDEVDVQRERIAAVSGTDTATKIALGLGDKEALLELERLERTKSMTPEQLLVLAAEKSPAAAAALAERFKAEGRMNEDLMDQLRRQIEAERQINAQHAGQLERVLNQALDKMGDVATARAKAQGPGSTTIIGGGGRPVIIDPQSGEASEGERA